MSETFEFIDAEYAHGSAQDIPTVRPSVAAMCVWLGVSRSGYYEWRDRPESATARRREELKHLIIVSFEESDGTYGYRRVHADLAAWGVTCGPELVRSMMRELGLVPCQPRPWRHSLTDNDGQDRRLPDLVGRDFTAEAPGQKMVGSGSRRESHPPAPTEPCHSHPTLREPPTHRARAPPHLRLTAPTPASLFSPPFLSTRPRQLRGERSTFTDGCLRRPSLRTVAHDAAVGSPTSTAQEDQSGDGLGNGQAT